ncbi:MAG: hypothetical protein FWE05_12430 [Defluviitaleaceae bacterium]|nr:hypothetical protein [Defluviitaleaceae bacterium]
MESKIMLYDAEGKKVGETFMRRARQLVKQQRATWMTDDHSAIQFVADTEDFDELTEEEIKHTEEKQDDALLMYIAKQNVAEKRQFKCHLIAYIIAWPLLAILYFGIMEPALGMGMNALPHWEIQNLRRTVNDVPNQWQSANLEVHVLEAEWRNDASFTIEAWHDSALWTIQRIERRTIPVLWFIMMGALFLWGGWILSKVPKYMRQLQERIFKFRRKTRPDPVEIEYQRLRNRFTE